MTIRNSTERNAIFTFKCVDCGTKNKVPEYLLSDSCMYQCSKCGYMTVQAIMQAQTKVGRTTTTWKPGNYCK